MAVANRATFVVDGPAGLLAVVDLSQANGRLDILQIGVEPGAHEDHYRHALIRFTEVAARSMGVPVVGLSPGVLPDGLAAALGYDGGTKSIRLGRLAQLREHLETVGVPLWRDGAASLSQNLYYRGVWAAMALIIGLGSVSFAVFNARTITLLHIVVPALLCIVTTAFALWQISLVSTAARRAALGIRTYLTVGAAMGAIFAIGALIYDRAIPAILEMWAIYSGDEALNDLALSLSDDKTTLYVSGSYGIGGAEVVGQALRQNPGLRAVVLAGPGGRLGTAFEINRLIRERRLATRVETTCVSACTVAFLGGVDRSISRTAKLGFHQGSFPGMGENDMYESNRAMKQFLIYRGGVSADFAARVVDTPAGSIWVPTAEELMAGRVINRVNQ